MRTYRERESCYHNIIIRIIRLCLKQVNINKMRKPFRYATLFKGAFVLLVVRLLVFLLTSESNNENQTPWRNWHTILWKRDVLSSRNIKDLDKKWDRLTQNNNTNRFVNSKTSGMMSKMVTGNHFRMIKTQIPKRDMNSRQEGKVDLPGQEYEFPHFIANNPPDGAGENSSPVIIDASKLPASEKKKFDEGWKNNGFSQYVSDMISVNRRLPDVRNKDCQKQTYNWSLPEVSVIICFHNEAWTVLLRSVHSILSRSPPRLLREIILVDDLSTMDHLKEPLDRYTSKLEKVKIVRAKTRQGLTRARLLGFSIATAPVIVFLDSHIECFTGWLEPVLAPIAMNPHTVSVPVIDRIDTSTFKIYSNSDIMYIGNFDWAYLEFSWMFISQERRKKLKSKADPVRSPTMPGGLFAISRDYFIKLGTYDPGLDYWGGENMELSFKVWMCNGTLEFIPCSHVAHVFRRSNPIKWPFKLQAHKNYIRVAEVWMDQYKKYHYEVLGIKPINYGDISERKRLRESLHCKSFDWYRKNVIGDIDGPDRCLAAGEIRNVGTETCLDSMGEKNRPAMYLCHGRRGTQFWYLKQSGEISHIKHNICLKNKSLVLSQYCTAKTTWKYRQDKTLFNKNTGLCLQADYNTDNILLEACQENKFQQWILELRNTD